MSPYARHNGWAGPARWQRVEKNPGRRWSQGIEGRRCSWASSIGLGRLRLDLVSEILDYRVAQQIAADPVEARSEIGRIRPLHLKHDQLADACAFQMLE